LKAINCVPDCSFMGVDFAMNKGVFREMTFIRDWHIEKNVYVIRCYFIRKKHATIIFLATVEI
jgi:hypothetical protein